MSFNELYGRGDALFDELYRCMRNDPAALAELVDRRMEELLLFRCDGGRNVLHLAAKIGTPQHMAVLLERFRDILMDETDESGQKFYCCATATMLEHLLRQEEVHGMIINDPLFFSLAAKSEDEDFLVVLLQQVRAEFFGTEVGGEPMLVFIAASGSICCIDLVLQNARGEFLSATVSDGTPILHYTVQQRFPGTGDDYDILKYLLFTYPEQFLTLYDDDGLTAMHHLLQHVSDDVGSVVFHAVANYAVVVSSGYREPCTHNTIRRFIDDDENGSISGIYDLKAGILNLETRDGLGLFHYCMKTQNTTLLRGMLSFCKAKFLAARDSDGDTPFVFAILNGYSTSLEYVLGDGSAFAQCDPGSVVLFESMERAISLLNIEAALPYLLLVWDDTGKSILHVLALSGNSSAVADVLTKEPLVALTTQTDLNGYLPLHYAVKSGDCETVRSLLPHSDITAKTDNESEPTVFHIALRYGHTNVLEGLLSYLGEDTEILTSVQDGDGHSFQDLLLRDSTTEVTVDADVGVAIDAGDLHPELSESHHDIDAL